MTFQRFGRPVPVLGWSDIVCTTTTEDGISPHKPIGPSAQSVNHEEVVPRENWASETRVGELARLSGMCTGAADKHWSFQAKASLYGLMMQPWRSELEAVVDVDGKNWPSQLENARRRNVKYIVDVRGKNEFHPEALNYNPKGKLLKNSDTAVHTAVKNHKDWFTWLNLPLCGGTSAEEYHGGTPGGSWDFAHMDLSSAQQCNLYGVDQEAMQHIFNTLLAIQRMDSILHELHDSNIAPQTKTLLLSVLPFQPQPPNVMVVCAGGVRSVFAIAKLIEMGYPGCHIFHANIGIGCG